MTMIRLFKKKTKAEKLSEKYRQLLKEAHKLSKINRTQSEVKFAEAMAVQSELEKLTSA